MNGRLYLIAGKLAFGPTWCERLSGRRGRNGQREAAGRGFAWKF